MSMRPSDKDIEGEIREAEKLHETAHRALCEQAVTKWNALMERGAARHPPNWSPMIGVAIAAQFYFLDVLCPGCHQVKQVDLRTLNRHERTTLPGLIPKLSCRSCQPNPPFAKLVRLSQHAWASGNEPAHMPVRRT